MSDVEKRLARLECEVRDLKTRLTRLDGKHYFPMKRSNPSLGGHDYPDERRKAVSYRVLPTPADDGSSGDRSRTAGSAPLEVSFRDAGQVGSKGRRA